jgi:hypothetical protein
MIEEYARGISHVDLLRERIDGRAAIDDHRQEPNPLRPLQPTIPMPA